MITKNAKKPSNSLVNIVVHLDWRRGFIEEHRGGTPKRFYVGVMRWDETNDLSRQVELATVPLYRRT
jgi:hypothetical protein